MRAVLENLSANDEAGLVACGQSNRQPKGDRDTEGLVEAPHLALRAAGIDLTIAAIVSADGAAHGAVGTQSIVTVAEELLYNDWIHGELRLVHHEFGDSVASSLRRGRADVLGCVPSAASAVGVDEATDTITWPSHGRANGSQVVFATTGTLPGLTAGAVYYVRDATVHTFKVSADPYGAVVNLAGGVGIQVATGRPYLRVQWTSAFQAVVAGITFAIGTPGVVTHTAHGLPAGSTIEFDANVPPELTVDTPYYVIPLDADTYALSATLGGAPIDFTGAGGTANGTPDLLAFVSGYVHLHDRFNSYDNVHVVTPYQPIEPGDYPAGTPVVPGFTLQADVLSYADAALALPYAWNEGVDGYGASGTATVAGTVVTLSGGQTIEPDLFDGGFIRVGGAKGKVASNTSSAVTVESWTPAAGPGAGTLAYTLHLPHWRNNPHHFTAGEGFLYPSGEMQPGGQLLTSTGLTYSRPRGRLDGSYVDRELAAAPASSSVAASALAQLKTTAAGQITAQVSGGFLILSRATTSSDPITGVIQFEAFLRAGYIVELDGLGLAPDVDGYWRVTQVDHTTASGGSVVYLQPLDPLLTAVPGSVSGTIPADAVVRRVFYKPVHRFGALLETAWRLANAIGRRVVVAHLGIDGSSQILSGSNNVLGFQGKLGWFDDDMAYDWTPSRSAGLAARLQRLVEFIAPRAVKASYGTSKLWKVLAADVWQGETDSLTPAGRALAPRSVPTFVNWLRSVIVAASLSPYRQDGQVPVHWAQITTDPWELDMGAGGGGDLLGEVNAAIARMVAFDGFAATFDPDDSPKLPDGVHFNGIGEARNGKAVADLLLPLIEFAFQFALGAGAIDVANTALSLIGDASNVTALEPPNGTTGAKLCAQMLPDVRKEILQSHPFTFATRRVTLQLVTAPVSSWAYAYALPPDLLHPTAVLDPEAPDDLQVRASKVYDPRYPSNSTALQNASQPFKIETDQEGNRILRTDQPNAVLVYVARNVDFRLWDPLVRQACAYRLAHKLAGGTIKGKTGAALSRDLLQTSMALLAQAAGMNAEFQQDVRPQVNCDWLP